MAMPVVQTEQVATIIHT